MHQVMHDVARKHVLGPVALEHAQSFRNIKLDGEASFVPLVQVLGLWTAGATPSKTCVWAVRLLIFALFAI